jgi:hypothetical protein
MAALDASVETDVDHRAAIADSIDL